MAIVSTILDLIMELAVPWGVLAFNILHIPKTIQAFITAGQYSKLFSVSEFTSSWFANFWDTIGPTIKKSYEPDVVALLHGRVLNGKIYDHVVSKPVSGVVLEVGAGNGSWNDVFAGMIELQTARACSAPCETCAAATHEDRHQDVITTATAITTMHSQKRVSHTTPDPPITKIFGVEPNGFFVTTLRRQIVDCSNRAAGGIFMSTSSYSWRLAYAGVSMYVFLLTSISEDS